MSKKQLSVKNKTYLMTANDRGKSSVEMLVGASVILKGSKHILFHNCYLQEHNCRSTGLLFEGGILRNSPSDAFIVCFPLG